VTILVVVLLKIRLVLGNAVYGNEYMTENRKWMIKKLHYNGIIISPYEDGW